MSGCGADSVPRGEDHLVVRCLRSALAHVGADQPGLRLTCRNSIPHGRGLGSSAAAIVAGLVAARGLLADPAPLSDQVLFELATAAEGHPDNASASLFGGLTLSWTEPDGPGGVDPARRAPPAGPPGRCRGGRPGGGAGHLQGPGDAAGHGAARGRRVHRRPGRAAGRGADPAPGPAAGGHRERLHQEQRAPAMPATADAIAGLRAAGHAAVVSGAGPSILILVPDADTPGLDAIRAVTGPGWAVQQVAIDTQGVQVVTER